MSADRNYILSGEIAEKKMKRMALEILEHNQDEKSIVLAGIRGSGMVIAKCIKTYLSEFSPISTELIEISLDKKNPVEVTLSQTPQIDERVVVIIDDVSNSGRTLLYAIKPFLDFHPRKIQTLILVERTHTHFPVRPDYVGLSIATTLQDHIYVEVGDAEVKGAYLQ